MRFFSCAAGDDSRALIDARRVAEGRLSEFLGERAYEVAQALFPELPLSEVWLALADTMGHLELLEARGEIHTKEEAGQLIVETTKTSGH